MFCRRKKKKERKEFDDINNIEFKIKSHHEHLQTLLNELIESSKDIIIYTTTLNVNRVFKYNCQKLLDLFDNKCIKYKLIDISYNGDENNVELQKIKYMLKKTMQGKICLPAVYICECNELDMQCNEHNTVTHRYLGDYHYFQDLEDHGELEQELNQ